MNKNIKVYIFLLFSLFSLNSKLFATAQASDILIFENEIKELFTNPLDQLFLQKEEVRNKFDKIFSNYKALIPTACWRGYIAKFAIKNDYLYVIDVFITISVSPKDKSEVFDTEKISIFSELFETDIPVVCDFFTGVLTIPQGNMINYIHGGYLSEFEEYILIKVNSGKIIEQGKYNLENYKNKKQQAFERFYGSAKYNESWNSIKNNFEDIIEENSKKEIMKACEELYLYDFYEF